MFGAQNVCIPKPIYPHPINCPTGRSLSLLDPTYASKYIPIIASVSEHQPPAWNSYFTDLQSVVLLMPVGLIAAFRPLTDSSLFLVLYGLTAVYFSGVMVRKDLHMRLWPFTEPWGEWYPGAQCFKGLISVGSEYTIPSVPRQPYISRLLGTSSGASNISVLLTGLPATARPAQMLIKEKPIYPNV